MRSILKKIAAVVLAMALCLSFAGCYDENMKWAAKKGDDTLPIGGYIYYLNSALSEARSKIGSDTEVLKGTVEDKDAQTWIKDRALNYLQAYYYIGDKFKELGLELTEEEMNNVSGSTDSMWVYYKTSMEGMGIAKESFNQAFSLYNARFQKVRDAVYGKGGEMEVSEDELKTYYVDNYYNYEYFYASLTKNNDDGESEAMTDDEKKDAKEKLENMVKEINDGEMTVTEAASKYAEDALGSADSSTYQAASSTKKDNIATEIKAALDGAKENDAVFVETDSYYYVVRLLPIEDSFKTQNEDESQRTQLIADMKGDEFNDYVLEQAKSVEGLEINQKALDRVKVSKLITDSNKNGASSAPESSSSETSSSESSTAESSAASSETE